MFRTKRRSRLRRAFFFYPGGTVAKRFFHLLVIYSISLNLYVGYIQEELFFESQCLIEEAEDTVAKFQAVADAGVDALKSINELLWWSDIDWWTYGSIATQGNETVQKVEAQKKVIDEYSNRLKQYGSVYATMSALLKILTWLFWIRVAFSLIWLTGDAMFSGARKAIIFFLGLSLISNYLLYNYMVETYPLQVLPETLASGFFSTMDFLEGTLNTTIFSP